MGKAYTRWESGMERDRAVTELERNNRTAKAGHLINIVVVIALILLETWTGKRSMVSFMIVVVIGVLPVIAEQFFWLRDHETPAIKHLVAIGYALFYTIVLFTTSNQLVFTFVFPMILVISIYNDARYTMMINAGVIIENLLHVMIGASTGGLGYRSMDDALLQIGVVILMAVYSYYTALTLYQNAKQKIDTVSEAQSETEKVLHSISELSSEIKDGIEEINGELEKLGSASKKTGVAMQQVSSGTSETADSVQHQLEQTTAIREKVELAGDASEHIRESMQQTLEVLKAGNRDVEFLAHTVDVSVQNGVEVAGKLQTLDGYIEQMHSIVELIQNVATAIREVVEVVQQMIDGINEEKQSAENTVSTFECIQQNTFAIRDNIEQLADHIQELKHANDEIMDTIQTISAISQEVSAHASETQSAQEENGSILGQIAHRMQKLVDLTNQ